jgi:hypothetical protein
MNDEPGELHGALRNQGFEEIERVAHLASSYALSTGEAAFRGDAVTTEIHLKQLRLCLMSMIETCKGLNGG